MNKKKIINLLSTLLLSILVLTSCASDFEIKGTNPGSSAPQASASALSEEEFPTPGGDLFISMPQEIETLDPFVADNEELINILSLIYDSPFKYNADGTLEENLIESWSVNETKQIFTFKIKQDVYFSDGTQLTANDIVYSANRLLNNSPSNESNESGNDDAQTENEDGTQMPQPIPETSSLNEETSSRFSRFGQYVSAINAIDTYTVELRMNKAGSAGLHFMTFPVMKASASGERYLIGTGPYMAESFEQGDDMRLVRNPLWWGGSPYIDAVVARSVSSQTQALDYVESSIIDFTTTDALYAGNYRIPGQIQVIDYITNYYDCLVPNLLKPSMQNALVRQAISYGIDRREILAIVLLNHGVPTNLPIAPDFFAYDSEYKINDYGNADAIEFLKQAGYATDETSEGEILSLDLLIIDDRDSAYIKEAARAIKKQLAELGIEINIIEKPPGEYTEALNSGDFDLAYVSYYLDIVPDIEGMFLEDSPLNVGHVSSSEILEAARQCELALTEEEIKTAYSTLQRVLADRVPQIGLYFRTNSIVCDETIRGITDIRQNLIFSDIGQWYNYIPGLASAENLGANQQNYVIIENSVDPQSSLNSEESSVDIDSGININYAAGENNSQWSINESNDSLQIGGSPNIYDDVYNNTDSITNEAQPTDNADEFTPLVPTE